MPERIWNGALIFLRKKNQNRSWSFWQFKIDSLKYNKDEVWLKKQCTSFLVKNKQKREWKRYQQIEIEIRLSWLLWCMITQWSKLASGSLSRSPCSSSLVTLLYISHSQVAENFIAKQVARAGNSLYCWVR